MAAQKTPHGSISPPPPPLSLSPPLPSSALPRVSSVPHLPWPLGLSLSSSRRAVARRPPRPPSDRQPRRSRAVEQSAPRRPEGGNDPERSDQGNGGEIGAGSGPGARPSDRTSQRHAGRAPAARRPDRPPTHTSPPLPSRSPSLPSPAPRPGLLPPIGPPAPGARGPNPERTRRCAQRRRSSIQEQLASRRAASSLRRKTARPRGTRPGGVEDGSRQGGEGRADGRPSPGGSWSGAPSCSRPRRRPPGAAQRSWRWSGRLQGRERRGSRSAASWLEAGAAARRTGRGDWWPRASRRERRDPALDVAERDEIGGQGADDARCEPGRLVAAPLGVRHGRSRGGGREAPGLGRGGVERGGGEGPSGGSARRGAAGTGGGEGGEGPGAGRGEAASALRDEGPRTGLARAAIERSRRLRCPAPGVAAATLALGVAHVRVATADTSRLLRAGLRGLLHACDLAPCGWASPPQWREGRSRSGAGRSPF